MRSVLFNGVHLRPLDFTGANRGSPVIWEIMVNRSRFAVNGTGFSMNGDEITANAADS